MEASKEHIALIEETWELMAPKGSQITISFYEKLFELAPEVRKMFQKDISKQAEKLLFTMGFLVSNVNRIDEIAPSIEQLGILHGKAYRVKDEHYQFVIESLIYTLSHNLEDIWGEEHEKAWRWTLDTVAKIMIKATSDSLSHKVN
ncbi:MAG: globin domain-containing protein [Cyclobacteriaceae bacterium]